MAAETFPSISVADSAPSVLPSNPVESEVSPQDKFTTLRDKVLKLANSWRGEVNETQTRREMRYMKINVEQMRTQGLLKADEIHIPIRVINDNISKEQAQYYAYLTTSRNTAIFKPKQAGAGSINTQPLEEWFTKVSRYEGWEQPHFQTLDGTQTHGWDFVEVVLDKDKPGHFGIEHISHENAWFPFDIETHNFQDTPIFVRNCRVTEDRLKGFKDVDLEQVELLFKDTAHVSEVNATSEVQKVMYREQGIIYVCWMSYSKGSAFIRAPKPLWLGRQKIYLNEMLGVIEKTEDIYETQYPVEVLPYIISEDGMLKNTKGRAFFDEYIQEAASSLVSSIVNSYHRASLVMGAPKNGAAEGAMMQTDCPIEGGRWYNQPAEFFHMPYPDAQGMSIVNGLLTQNKTEAGQINYAVGNRSDYASRKTAKEISSAESESSLLRGVQVTLYSIFLRRVYKRCWNIAQSRAQQGLLEEISQDVMKLMNMEYELFPAGDTEVIKREENKQALLQSWGVVSTTPAAMLVLEDLLTMLFPDRAPIYIAALRQGDPKQLLGAVTGILAGIVQAHPEVVPPGKEQQIGQIIQLGNSTAGATDSAPGAQGEQPQPQPQAA